MIRQKSKQSPYFAKLLNILIESKGDFNNSWNANYKILNNLIAILVKSSDGHIEKIKKYDDQVTWRFTKGKRQIPQQIVKYYRSVNIDLACAAIEKTIKDDINIKSFLDKELCLKILKIFTDDSNLNSHSLVRGLELYVSNNEFIIFFTYVLYYIASDLKNFDIYVDNIKSGESQDISVIHELRTSYNNGLFFDSIDRDVVITPNPKENVIETVTTTKIVTRFLNAKKPKADYFEFVVGFEYKNFRERHRIECLKINGEVFQDNQIIEKEWEKPDSKQAYKKTYRVEGIKDSPNYAIEVVQKSILNFPVGEIIYRLKESASKFKFVAKLSELNKEDKHNFKIAGHFFGSFKHDDRIRFVKSNNQYFEVEIDRYTLVGSGVKIDIRPHNKLLKYAPPE
jgi:hypothetical protein